MGLLKATDILKRSDIPGDIRFELNKAWDDLRRIRRHNESLVSQVNNLLHFINEQNRRKRDLQQRIVINAKTGLPNHNKMDQELQSFFDSLNTLPEQPPVAIILVKLGSNFDIINKTLKPSVSEWVIYQMASRLKELMDEGTPIYHTRDDEFLVVLNDRGDESELVPMMDEIFQQISKPHIFAGYHISIDCNIGVAVFPKDGLNKSRLLNNADIALNYAKKNNRRHVFFIEKMRDDVVKKMELQNSIIKALEEQSIKEIDKQFFLYYQPILTLDRTDGGKPNIVKVDAETLIRWKHPERGMIMPDSFIPIAEETGLIIIIGKWVLYNAAAEIEDWQGRDIHSSLAMNVSPRQFNDDDLVDSVSRIVNFRDIDPEFLQLEITENSFLDDPTEAIRKIKKLKDMGLRIAIDDFGTGFSSMNYLRKLPVDVVKIDRSFVNEVTTSQHDQSIVKAILALSQEMGIANVVEGVETWDQLNTLMNFGCTRFQGFLFSKPLTGEDYRSYYGTGGSIGGLSA